MVPVKEQIVNLTKLVNNKIPKTPLFRGYFGKDMLIPELFSPLDMTTACALETKI